MSDATVSLGRLRELIVDDQPFVRSTIANTLGPLVNDSRNIWCDGSVSPFTFP